MRVGIAYIAIRAKLDKLDKDLQDAKKLSEKRAKETHKRVSAVFTGLVAYFGVRQISQFGEALFSVGRQMSQLEKSYQAITGSAKAADQQFEFLRDTAKRLGQSFYDLTDPYKQILAAGQGTELQGRKTQEIFEAIIQSGASLSLTADEVKGSLNAVSQMMSKGTVQAEELRGQLGERLPGAFNLAAEAMGVTTSELGEMLQKGEVLAADLLPKLADVLKQKYSGEVDAATRASNLFRQAWVDIKLQLAESGFLDAITTAMQNLADTMTDPVFQDSIKQLGENLGTIALKLSEIAKYAGLRSLWGTAEDASRLAKEGRLDWKKWLKASALERQKMLDEALSGPQVSPHEAFRLGQVGRQPPEMPVHVMPEIVVTAKRLEPIVKPQAPEISGDFWDTGGLEDFQNMYADHVQYMEDRYLDFVDQQSQLDPWESGRMTLEDFKTLVDEDLTYCQQKYQDFISQQAQLDPELFPYDSNLADLDEALNYLEGRFIKLIGLSEELDPFGALGTDQLGDFLEEFSKYDEALQERFRSIQEASQETADQMQAAFSGWAHSFSHELNEAFWGAEFSFGKILESFAKMCTEMIIQTQILQPLLSSLGTSFGGGGGGGGGGFWGGLFGLIGSAFGFGFSRGGYLGEEVVGIGRSSGQSYEFHGNEYVIPASKLEQSTETDGRQATGDTYNIAPTYNVSAIDARGVADFFAQNKAIMTDNLIDAVEERRSQRDALRGLIY